jgi:hypothetical protein
MWFVGVRERRSCALVPPRLLVIGAAIAFVVAGCSGGGDSDTESSQPSNPPVGEESSPQLSAGGLIIASEPLGFETAVYEVPEPPAEDPDVPLPPFTDSLDLIDAGVESGVWTEAEGVRAIMSILLGELPPEAVPEFDQLLAKGHAAVLTRAQEILADPAVDEAVRADLARLTNFFLSDSPYGPPGADGEASAPGEPAIVLASTRGVPRQSVNCGVSEVVLYGAQSSGLCYKEVTRGEDTILVPIEEGFDDVSDMVFGTIDRARDGYLDFTGFELQPVTVLLSPRESPADAEYAQGDVLGAVRSAGSSNCRLAIYVDSEVTPGDPEFRNTVAHELFHCIQGIWGGGSSDDFVVEGGASYFSYRLLNECVGGLTGWGPTLDQKTTNGSLLDLEYAGWYFWAFLDEQGYMTVQEIATLHRATYAGTDVEEGLGASVDDLPAAVNKFYARLMGPGLSCGMQGNSVTSTLTVDSEGPIALDASLWVGTRYKLDYAEKSFFEQKSEGPDPIAMAEFSKRSDESSWVITEPEIRTECSTTETWIVVIGAQSDSSSTPPTTLEVTKVSEGVCDACLIGEWAINLDTMEPFFESLSAGIKIELTGDWTFNFGRSDGGPTAPFSDERDIALTFTEDRGSIAAKLEGKGGGPYTADGTSLQVLSYADTVTVSIGAVSGLFSDSDDGGGVAYLCDEDVFTFTFAAIYDVTADRVPESPQGDPYFV